MYRSHFRIPFTMLSVATLMVTAVLTYGSQLFASAAGGCPLSPGRPYSVADNPAVYYVTTDCTRQLFSGDGVYYSHFASWSDIRVVSPNLLASIPWSEDRLVPWGPLLKYGDRTLMKVSGDPRVYLYVNGSVYPVLSVAVAKALLAPAQPVVDVSPDVIAHYPKGPMITSIHDDPAAF